LFHLLHKGFTLIENNNKYEEKFEIAGVEVDINPITEEKTGPLAEYLESAD